jgi:diguanylate cyclase (GGDEF)-like protein
MEKTEGLLKILICDDDPQDRKLIQTFIRQTYDREIVALEAGRRTEIQNAIDKGRIDLILMDIQMPEKSGMEWLTEIVEKQIAPVVMLTGHGNEEVAVQSIQQGAVGYTSKSNISKEKLLDTIDNALARWRQLQLSRANQEQMERLATIDSLTGLLNRRTILHRLCQQMRSDRRYNEKLTIGMLDIDHFKIINDKYGHIIGDDVLEKIAALIYHNVRDTDLVGRYGGEEFLIIMTKTDLSCGREVADRIRKIIEESKMRDPRGDVFGITVSQGLSSYKVGDDEYKLISRADKALYAAKNNGRNRVETSASIICLI